MSILIEGMEMPKGRDIVVVRSDGFAGYIAVNPKDAYTGKAISVSEPHGRLGDIDEIIRRLKKWQDHPDKYISQRNKDMIYILEKEDAVIPASGKEVE